MHPIFAMYLSQYILPYDPTKWFLLPMMVDNRLKCFEDGRFESEFSLYYRNFLDELER